MEEKIIKFEPSKRTILMGLLLVAIIFFGKNLVSIAVILFLAFILSSFILPIYRWLVSKKIKKGLAVVIITAVFIISILVVFSSVFLPFFLQLEKLLKETPDIVEKIAGMITKVDLPFFELDESVVKASIEEYISSLTKDIIPNILKGFEGVKATFTAIADIGSLLLTFLTIFAIAIYFVIDHDMFVSEVLNLLRIKKKNVIKNGLDKLEGRLSKWIIGEFILMFVIGFLTWIFLTVIGIPFALPLAVLAGFLELIPNLGPILSSVPAIIIALFEGGPLLAIGVAFGYVVIQQLENNLIVPKIMGDATGIHPLIILVGMLFGFQFGGVLGALIAVPCLVIGKIAWEFYTEFRDL